MLPCVAWKVECGVEKVTVKQGAILGILLLSTSVRADVLIDQIGNVNGGSVGAVVAENQYFEPKFAKYDIATLENFTITATTTVTSIEFVMYGWNGFSDPSSITGFQANIYALPEDAGTSLVGNEATQEIDVADVSINQDWLGLGFLVSAPANMLVDVGDHWISFIPRNPFATDGLTGVLKSLLGDGVMAVQANPSGVYGFGSWQTLTLETAIRLHVGEPNDPCELALSSKCPEDVNGDGIVSTTDLLDIIAQWGDCGDGTYRPSADIAPLPNGDCCVNLSDILALIAAWGADCNEYGACCLLDGTCVESMSAVDCQDLGGYFAGENVPCIELSCDIGACCIDSQTCNDLSELECTNNSGSFEGDGTACATFDCAALEEGDDCEIALLALEGSNSFDTARMTPSQPQPDESSCTGSELLWANSNDVWFIYVPTKTHNYSFSLCDPQSYDTSMVVYSGSCNNQVACNGDSTSPEGNCQPYYSALDYYAIAGETYYIRIGGWQGETGAGTLTITEIPLPIPGACCFAEANCVDNLIADDCAAFGGEFAGEGTQCSNDACLVAAGDECIDATQIYIGLNGFDTTDATASTPEPDDSMCVDTYLYWENSPDIWMYWVATASGVATFTTCDLDTYDTSIVLYEDTCENQVACNGDGSGQAGCQQYYSSIEYPVNVGSTYFVRMGGWQGMTGTGSITITLLANDDLGACCTSDVCNGALTNSECSSLGGEWFNGELCKDLNCAAGSCENAVFTQNVHGVKDAWFSGTSAYDPSNQMLFNRAEFVMVDAMQAVTVWGFQLFLDNSKWIECDTTLAFNIRTYSDIDGLPGAVTTEALSTPAVSNATGELYGGQYELMQWDMGFIATNVEHLGVQSISKGEGCWFLWMSSGSGDSLSAVNAGSGWSFQQNDLSICIE